MRLANIGVGILLFVTFELLSPRAAHAQSEDEYREVVGQAVTLLDAERWQEAYALFRRAHQLRPSARTLRGLGKAALGLQHYVESIQLLEQSLRDSRNPLDARLRAEVEGLLARSRSVVARLRVTCTAPGATARLDDSPIPLDAEVLVDPGDHPLAIEAEGFQRTIQMVRLGVSESESIAVNLEPVVAAPPPPPDPAQREPTPTDPTLPNPTGGDAETALDQGYVPWAIVVTVIAVGSLGGAIGAHALAEWNGSESRRLCGEPPMVTNCAEYAANFNTSRDWAIAAYATAAVSSAAAITLWILDAVQPGRAATSTRSSSFVCLPGPYGIGCAGTF